LTESKSSSVETGKRGSSRKESPDELTQQNVELIRQLEQAAKQERSPSDLVAEAVANFCGSMTFVWVHVLWFGAWILINAVPDFPHIDPFPFTFLTSVVSLEAIFLSTFILISQNHDTKISERRNHLDLQINLLSEQENTKIITILQASAAKVGAEIPDDPELHALREEIAPEKLAKQTEAREDE
jgi:uncharacterized membrane protein